MAVGDTAERAIYSPWWWDDPDAREGWLLGAGPLEMLMFFLLFIHLWAFHTCISKKTENIYGKIANIY